MDVAKHLAKIKLMIYCYFTCWLSCTSMAAANSGSISTWSAFLWCTLGLALKYAEYVPLEVLHDISNIDTSCCCMLNKTLKGQGM